MCFAPQWYALFQHLNFQKWFEHLVFLWLGNVLRAAMAGTFWTAQLPKVLRGGGGGGVLPISSQRRALFEHLNFQKSRVWTCFHILTSICASHPSRLHFPTSPLPKFPRTSSVCSILISKCASCHSGCTFWYLIWPDGSASATLAKLLLDPPEPQNIGKNSIICDFSCAHTEIFFWFFLWPIFFLSSFWFFPLLWFHLSIFLNLEIWFLNFF